MSYIGYLRYAVIQRDLEDGVEFIVALYATMGDAGAFVRRHACYGFEFSVIKIKGGDRRVEIEDE